MPCAASVVLTDCATTAGVTAAAALNVTPSNRLGSVTRIVTSALSPGARLIVGFWIEGFWILGFAASVMVVNVGFGMFTSRIVWGCSASAQSAAAGVEYVLLTSNWLPKPAGTWLFRTRLIAYDAVVLPSFVTRQLVS